MSVDRPSIVISETTNLADENPDEVWCLHDILVQRP